MGQCAEISNGKCMHHDATSDSQANAVLLVASKLHTVLPTEQVKLTIPDVN